MVLFLMAIRRLGGSTSAVRGNRNHAAAFGAHHGSRFKHTSRRPPRGMEPPDLWAVGTCHDHGHRTVARRIGLGRSWKDWDLKQFLKQ